ncbi:uncharacterized protein LOC123518662 isoform X2 [Portunus trituberculatus]|uniref:uncharacterized protein LOC123518662 isoform X2 n=1 Tax=Portunus trituberculatus TaxID=210409 RepID=UPI001E1CDF03|nr:uncharacterized protein LOC123518662 isoform X2 [Portunus trituberculatus]
MANKFPSSDTGGVKAFPIQGPWKDERVRLAGMTDADRAFRKQWLKDQILAESEPAVVPGYYEARYNPIRRFYRWPLDTLFKPLVPMLGYEKAAKYRWYTGKIGLVLGGVLLTYYYFKYNTNDWTRKGGWRVLHSIENVVPGDPRYPMVSDRKVGADYASGNFKNSPI